MMNNNTQVSLRNGANFSHIRMALFGTKLPKLQPGGPAQWYLDLYKNNSSLGNWNSNLNSSYAGATIVGQGNSSLHGKAGDLNAAWAGNLAYTSNLARVQQDILSWYDLWAASNPNATPEQMVAAYNQIAQQIRDYLAQAHTYNSRGAATNNLAFKLMFSSRSLKADPNADMSQDAAFIGYQDSGDDIYGSSSFLRRMDRYEKDWDALTDAEKAGRTHTIKIGGKDVQVYKKANGDISLLPDQPGTPPGTPPDNPPETPPGTPPGTPPDNPGDPWEPVDYPTEPGLLKKFRFPTFPLYNAALFGVADITNKRILDTLLKAPSMRYEAPTLLGKVTNAYFQRAANNLALLELKWGIQLLINNTSDLGIALKAERDLRSLELDTQMQNNAAKQNEFNLTTLNLLNITNTNKLNWTNTANLNRQAWVAESRDRLNAIAQYQAQRGQNLQENIMSNYTDWKAWNRNNMLQDYADWQANEGAKVLADLLAAYDEYRNAEDITKYKPYDEFWASQLVNGQPRNDTKFGLAYANYLKTMPGADASDPELRKKFFMEHMNDDFGGELDSFLQGWADYKSNALSNYATAQNKINTSWGLTKGRYNPLQFNGEVSPWLWRAMNGAPPSYQRQYMKKGGRFLEYLEHNRRAEKEIRDTTMKSMQESRRMLRRDLDALDRESLLLLRAIFK